MMVRETRAKAIRRAHSDGIEAIGCHCQHECYDADSSFVGMTDHNAMLSIGTIVQH
jgi:hypothetical protein